MKNHPGINDEETLPYPPQEQRTPCATCNGVLAAEMMKVLNHEQMAHAFVHAQSNAEAMRKELVKATALLGGLTSGKLDPSYLRGWDGRIAVEAMRAAISKAKGA